MPTISAAVDIDEFLGEIGGCRSDFPTDVCAKILGKSSVTVDVRVRQDEIDDHASEPDPEYLSLDASDLRDAVRALADGDLTMAGIMFGRALRDDAEAAAAVEDELRKIRSGRPTARLAVAA